MAQRRTTHRSSKGTKLYAVRKADGTFADMQTYKRAHAADLRKRSKSESGGKSAVGIVTKAAKRTVKKAAAAGSSMLGSARKAVGGMLKKVTAKKTPKRRAAKKAARKTARRKA